MPTPETHLDENLLIPMASGLDVSPGTDGAPPSNPGQRVKKDTPLLHFVTAKLILLLTINTTEYH